MADAEIQQLEHPSGGGESDDVQTEQTAKLVGESQEPVEAAQAPPSVVVVDSPNTEAKVVTPAAPEAKEVAPPAAAVVAPAEPAVTQNGTNTTAAKASAAENNTNDWQQKEAKLLEKIDQCETVKTDANLESLKLQLKVREEEIELLKARVVNLETELQAALSKPGSKNHEIIESIKQQHEELLSKARGMIFDKTKMVKNQELQIQALTTQVSSLKDINLITKDLLEIRNSEVKAMEDRLAALEGRIKAEKERHALQLQKTATTANLNDDLRKEYETQLALFKDLRVKYDERVKALIAENEKLKDVMEAKAEVVAAGNNVK